MIRALTLVACAACLAACSATSGHAPSPAAGPRVPAPSVSASPNTTTSDGGVALSIAGVACRHRTTTADACYVTFRAVNISDGFPVFTEFDQVAYDIAGRAYHPDAAADQAANHGKPVTQRLPRGVPVSGVLVFEVPSGAKLDHVVLHGQPGTPGETFPI